MLEKAGGMLWYACPYEGFEANEHVVYMHACPNQHLVPLLAHVVPRFGANGFLLGSNYIWGWEINRVARDLIADAGGKVLGERYLPHRRDRRVAADRRNPGDAAELRPQQSDRHLVLRLPRRLCASSAASDPHFRPERCPVLSCNLTEGELPAIGEVGRGPSVGRPLFPRRGDASGSAIAGLVLRGVRLCLACSVLADVLARRSGSATWPTFPRRLPSRRFPTPARADRHRSADPACDPAGAASAASRTIRSRRSAASEGVAPDPYLSRYDRHETFGRPAPEGGVMSRTPRIPNLGGAKALVLHRPHPTVQAITRQLSAIGLDVARLLAGTAGRRRWRPISSSSTPISASTSSFPWKPGEAPMPLIALIGSEAPGRIEWALSHKADAQLLKPVGNAGVYSALLIARQTFEARQAPGRRDRRAAPARRRAADHRARGGGAGRKGADDERAYAQLRSLAMSWQISVEEAARRIVAMAGSKEDGDDQSRRA